MTPALRPVYPFSAIVGQEEMKLALLLNVVQPRIGGAMIMGDRGTGKSTAVRALAQLLPPMRVVRGCRFHCDPERPEEWCSECRERQAAGEEMAAEEAPIPVVDLPLGATEDRITGTLDLELALTRGIRAFEPGLLARAHRGFLYIDEVNLLEDHLVDLLLDVAASGVNVVEREGISLRHPSRFILVGSGNPEEGELRPQLLDRFGLHVRVETITDLGERLRIVRHQERFQADPAAFAAEFAEEQAALRRRLAAAQSRVGSVTCSDALLLRVAELCLKLGIDGHRGELTIARAAAARAALEGRDAVGLDDVRAVAPLCLRHRLRRDPLEEIDSGERIRAVLDEVLPAGGEGAARAAGGRRL